MVGWKNVPPGDLPVLRILTALLLVLAAPSLAAAERGPSTPEERKRAVETTRTLEKEPLARRSMEARRWLFQWIVEIPDIHVTSCAGPLDPLLADPEDAYGQILWAQSVFGMTAFLVENPKKASDWAAVQTAGIESVLRAYASLRRSDSEARWPALDRLEKARKAGKLRDIVEKEMASCGNPESMMAPPPRDAI
jgi:hypothetical protein